MNLKAYFTVHEESVDFGKLLSVVKLHLCEPCTFFFLIQPKEGIISYSGT